MQMKKKVREEKGSMAVYVAVTLTSFLIILTAIYIASTSMRNTQLSTIVKIKESYEQGNDRIGETYQKIADQMAYFEDFKDWKNFQLTATAENNIVDGILSLRSSDVNPTITMEDVTSFNPREYRYIDIKYKTNSNAGSMKLIIGDSTIEKTLTCDGQWHTATFDLGLDANIWRNSPITGWTWVWTTESNVTMDVDYIRAYK